MTLCLDATTKSITLELGASPAQELSYTTHYASKTASSFSEKNTTGVSNGTTPVTIIPAPASGETLSIKNIILYNNSASTIIVTINLVITATSYKLFNITIGANSSWKLGDGLRGEAGTNGTSVTVTVLTQSAYDALGTYDSNTFYVING